MRLLQEEPPQGSAGKTTMRFVSSFFLICFFLWLGLQIRRIKIFRIFSMPAAVSGGFIGLIFLQLCKLNDDVYAVIVYDWVVGWSALPSILINIVFACLFLGKKLPTAKEAWRDGGPQVMYGQLIAWGNWSVSCLITGAILIPVFGVSPLFASMYAVGFEGGHGTAAGLADTYTALGEPTYGDIALTSATIGILMGSIVGVIIVNWGIATGKVAMHKDGTVVPVTVREETEVRSAEEGREGVEQDKDPDDEDEEDERKGEESLCKKMFGDRDVPSDIYRVDESIDERPTGGKQTVRQDALETLALHLVYISFACFFGYVILRMLWLIEYNVPALEEIKFFTSFPLFPLCMLGGLFVMWVHEKCGVPAPVDDIMMERIGGAAMEFLIVSAIAMINTEAVSDNIAPLMIIMIGGMTWNFVCFFVLAPRILPNFHFERAIVELGQSFGTTATGLLLLRMCDPEKDTPVWKAFGYKQMMTEPFMGGGVWTTVSLQLLATIGVWGVFGISSAFVLFWTCMYFFYFRKVYLLQAAAEKSQEAPNGEVMNVSMNEAEMAKSK